MDPAGGKLCRSAADFKANLEPGERRIFVTTGTSSGSGNLCATGDVSDCLKIIYVPFKAADLTSRYGMLSLDAAVAAP